MWVLWFDDRPQLGSIKVIGFLDDHHRTTASLWKTKSKSSKSIGGMDDLWKNFTGTKFYALSSFFLPRLSCCVGVAYFYSYIVHPFLYYDRLYVFSQDDSTLSMLNFLVHHWLRTITIFIGFVTGCVIVLRVSLSVYRRCFQPAKAISSYGKWAIIAGFWDFGFIWRYFLIIRMYFCGYKIFLCMSVWIYVYLYDTYIMKIYIFFNCKYTI